MKDESSEIMVQKIQTTTDNLAQTAIWLIIDPWQSQPSVTKDSVSAFEKTFKDNEAKPNQVENWLLQREMQIQEFGNIVIDFTVAGNTSRHVGDLIRFELPTRIPTDSPSAMATSLSHQLYSGFYIIYEQKYNVIS